MYELIQVSDKCYYIQSPAKIGLVITGDDEVCLIDSGNDRDAGKRIKRILEEKGWSLNAIYNTHAHADHCGGNQYLQKQTGCDIYASEIERDFAEHTILEPSYLFGADPPEELKHKFLMARGCDAMLMTKESMPEGMEMIPLPGHSFDMVGFRVSDDVVFLADCISSEETLHKYQISFLVDVAAYLDTLEMIQEMEGRIFIPSHAEPTDDISPLAKANIAKVRETGDTIVDICTDSLPFDTILKRIFDRYGLAMTFEQHALVGSTVRSYLTWLKDEGRLTASIEDNTLIWKKE